MSFFRNSQIARLYDVSPTTVTNWIEAAEKGHNQLELATIGNRRVIVDSLNNRNLIIKLKAKGKKHINTEEKKIKPKPEIYKIFDSKQLSEIYCSLTTKNEIPYKYTYLDKGADLWDKNYATIIGTPKDEINNDALKEKELFEDYLDFYINRLNKYKKVNLIDIGCGNGLPTVIIINKLFEKGFEVDYTAIDISQRMLEIDKEYILEKFPHLNYKSKVVDLDENNLSEITVENKNENSINLLAFLGSTLGNYEKDRIIFRNLFNSMSQGDLLLIGTALLQENDDLGSYVPNQYHFARTTWILDILGLKDFYNKSSLTIVDPKNMRETRKITIEKNISTEIKIGSNILPIKFEKFTDILVYKFSWYTELELIEEAIKYGFRIEQFTTNSDRSYGLMLLGV